MNTTLIIARHGNTFNKGDTILRVGGKTDLPLTAEGEEQGKRLGLCLKKQGYEIDKVYAAPLKRTMTTALKAIETYGKKLSCEPMVALTEIDYGVDEAKPETDVVARIGQDAMDKWNNSALPPDGWNVDPDKIIASWQKFAADIADGNETVLTVTSNGIARFALWLLDDYRSGKITDLNIKLSTGAFGVLLYDGKQWHLAGWNIKPKDELAKL